MKLRSILGISPYFEVLIKYIYWNYLYFSISKTKRKDNNGAPVTTQFSRVTEKLAKMGVVESDLAIVHSSFASLKPTGASPNAIIDGLIRLIGPGGTLAMPAIPYYDNEPVGRARMTADVSGIVLTYDIKNTKAWTGVLANELIKRKSSIRSKHPLNSMVAVGPLAETMMEKNIEGYKPLPCGKDSSWKFCADRHAKVIGLGVDLTHSLTMIHVAEDVDPESWPVRDWYRDRKCVIIDGNERREIVVRERHPKWAIHFAERTLCKDLLSEGILLRDFVDSIQLELLDSYRLLEYLNIRNRTGYPYYLLPK